MCLAVGDTGKGMMGYLKFFVHILSGVFDLLELSALQALLSGGITF